MKYAPSVTMAAAKWKDAPVHCALDSPFTAHSIEKAHNPDGSPKPKHKHKKQDGKKHKQKGKQLVEVQPPSFHRTMLTQLHACQDIGQADAFAAAFSGDEAIAQNAERAWAYSAAHAADAALADAQPPVLHKSELEDEEAFYRAEFRQGMVDREFDDHTVPGSRHVNMYDLCLGCRGQKMACKAAGKWQCMEHGVSCEVTRPCPSLAAIKELELVHSERLLRPVLLPVLHWPLCPACRSCCSAGCTRCCILRTRLQDQAA